VPLLGGGVAGFFAPEDEDGPFRRLAAFGLSDTSTPGPAIAAGEGLVGQCIAERRTISLSFLPPDFLPIASGLGSSPPSQSMALPLASREAVLAVVEVASVPATHAGRAVAARRAAAGRDHEPGDPVAQPAHRRPAGADAGAAGGTGGGQGAGRGSDQHEIDVPGQHEPRDPHADERDHRPVAPGAEDRPQRQAARLRQQGAQRRHLAARHHQRHPGFSKIEAGKLDIENTDFRIDDVLSSSPRSRRRRRTRKDWNSWPRWRRRCRSRCAAIRCGSARSSPTWSTMR
jgi:hypothetical protein